MLRFTVRDALWATAVVAIAIAWWLDHRRNDVLQNAAANQERAFEALVTYVVGHHDWRVAVSDGHIDVRRPGDKPGQASYSCTWTHAVDGTSDPSAKVWSRDTLRADDEANWGEKRTMPWEEGYPD